MLLAACALLLAACPGFGADQQGQVSVQFIRVPGTADDRTALLQLEDGRTAEVELPTTALSEPCEFAKPESWVLGKSVRDKDGNEAFETMGSTPSTKGQRQVVVVIDKGAINDGKLELICMDLAATADSFQFINASTYNISGELGIERFGIEPKEHALLKAEASNTDQHGRRFCTAGFSYLKDEEFVKFFDANWRLEEKVYALIIFHHEAMANKLKITVIRDFVVQEGGEDF